MKKKYLIIFIFIFIFSSVVKENLSAEFIFLKDGSIIDGAIVSDSTDSITVKTKENRVKKVNRNSIMRILYTELYMGKVYVQKTDGKNVICYMVDEDRETYTFRKELFVADEFKLKRDQVLFMARGNPTGLEGTAETDRIDLKWNAPYNAVKKYKVYIMGPGEKNYRLADETGSKNIIIKDLRSNTRYLFTVTAIDSAGDESVASNELKIITKNIKPGKPSGISIEKKNSTDMSRFTAEIKWDPASDPDGKVTGYNIYRHDSGKPELAGKSILTNYSIKDLSIGQYYLFSVKSVDDKKEESEDAAYIATLRSFALVEVSADYILPIGKLGNILKGGYGGLVSVYRTDFIYRGFDAGLTAGGWIFDGNGSNVDSSYMIPIMASFRYNIPVTLNLHFSPSIKAGYWYNSIGYMKLNQATLQTEKVTESAFEPAVYAGLTANYDINMQVKVFAGAGYAAIFESSGRVGMITMTAGAGVNFY